MTKEEFKNLKVGDYVFYQFTGSADLVVSEITHINQNSTYTSLYHIDVKDVALFGDGTLEDGYITIDDLDNDVVFFEKNDYNLDITEQEMRLTYPEYFI